MTEQASIHGKLDRHTGQPATIYTPPEDLIDPAAPDTDRPAWGDARHHRQRIEQLKDWVRQWKARADTAERALADERAKVAQWEADFPCDSGCMDYPEEECSRHGRRPADLWDRFNDLSSTLTNWYATLTELTDKWEAEADANEDTHPREARTAMVNVRELRATLDELNGIPAPTALDALADERAKVARVEALAKNAPLVPVHAGGGNLVHSERMVSADDLRAALAGPAEPEASETDGRA